MIPLRETKLSFWSKLGELQYKMVFPSQESLPNHMYSSDPFDWPSLTRGIAYWVSNHHNVTTHLTIRIDMENSLTFIIPIPRVKSPPLPFNNLTIDYFNYRIPHYYIFVIINKKLEVDG
jgi:hypothetical protein